MRSRKGEGLLHETCVGISIRVAALRCKLPDNEFGKTFYWEGRHERIEGRIAVKGGCASLKFAGEFLNEESKKSWKMGDDVMVLITVSYQR